MKIYSTITLAVVVLLINNISDARYSGGTGDPNNPYLIATPEDLNDIGNYPEDFNKHFILVNDVNLTQYTGTQFKIIGNGTNQFTGVFDGNDHEIWNFTWSSLDIDEIGLFGFVRAGGQIKNLGMGNVDINAGYGGHIGGLVGVNSGTIADCYSIGSVSGINYVGMLVGFNYDGTVNNCYSIGIISGMDCIGGTVGRNFGSITSCYSISSVSATGWCVGGLVGINEGGAIADCYSNGSVSGNGSVGELVGRNLDGMITSCYSSGDVFGNSSRIGGLVGHNSYGTITDCYSTSNVTSTTLSNVGGLVGVNDKGWITYCYSTGSVMGEGYYVGGLLGSNIEGSVVASFWDMQTSGQTTSAGGVGKTTAEMKTLNTFTDSGWDFVEIWSIGENQTYPYLRTEPAGDLNHDKKVNFEDLAILARHWLEGTEP